MARVQIAMSGILKSVNEISYVLVDVLNVIELLNRQKQNGCEVMARHLNLSMR